MDSSFEILREVNFSEDLTSEFEFDDADTSHKRKSSDNLGQDSKSRKAFKTSKDVPDPAKGHGSLAARNQFQALDAYTRHKKLINLYVLTHQGATEKLKRDESKYKTDQDIIRENHRFLWEDDEEGCTWGEQLAKKYYDRLFKEYCITDLSRYKEKKVGMRWRTEKELVAGKGQFFCGGISCDEGENLRSWEVNFNYIEFGEKKNALVKIRLCPDCSVKLNYGYKGSKPLKEKLPPQKTATEEDVDKNASTSSTCEKLDSTQVESDKQEKVVEGLEIWKQPIRKEAERSKEDIFAKFLEDMLL